MRGHWLVLCGVAAFLVLLAWLTPLAAVTRWLPAHQMEIGYSSVEGRVWNGSLRGLTWRGLDLGTARVSLNPLALLLGRLEIATDLDGSGLATGRAVMTRHFGGGLSIRDLALQADVGRLPSIVPLRGRVVVAIDRAELGGRGCVAATGSVETDALVSRPAGLDWSGPPLRGEIRCEGDALVVPLSGSGGADRVSAIMTMFADRTFRVRIEARISDQTVVGSLSAAGFEDGNGVLALVQEGRWQ